MMNNEVPIKFMSEDLVNALKYDIKKHDAKNINSRIESNKENSNWLSDFNDLVFEEKKYKYVPFELSQYSNEDHKITDFNNAIKLYEHFNHLPRYIITDERFWAWVNFDFGYKYALQSIPVKTKSTVGDHYLFVKGKRRGLFFGVLSRLYFWVDLSIDENNPEDKYLLTRFAMNNIERIRNLTWRANSNEKHIVRGVLKAELKLCSEYSQTPKGKELFKKAETGEGTVNLYTKLAKYISLYGGVRLLDVITEDEYEAIVYKEGKRIIEGYR